jgi:membrane-associated phospholipid phosphatase
MSSRTVVRAQVASKVDEEVDARQLAERSTGRGSGRLSAAAVVVVGYLAVVGSLVLTGLLLTHVLLHGTLGRWDDGSTTWLSTHRDGALNAVTGLASRSADTFGILAVALVVLIVLWVGHRWHQMAVLVTALALELSAFLAVNALVGRDRPAVAKLGSTPSTSSFPSGHTAATLVLYGAIALFASATARALVWRALAWLAATVMPAAVGFSRVYRGLHHPTDVVFGYALGCAVLLVAFLAVRTWGPTRAEVEVR